MASLAHRLNDLAAAHAQHLITDDDYRLLRQDFFQKYSTELPVKTPKHPQPQPPHTLPASGPPLRRKQSVVSGVANLFRRATGRSPKKHLPGVQEIVAAPAQPPVNSPDSPHLAPPSCRIQRKPSILSLIRSDQQQQQPPSSASQDTDENPAALIALIASTEEEYARLLDAFISLESSTRKRIQYKTARRLYTPTPTNVNVLIEGREWRKHTKPVPSIVLPPQSSSPINHRHHPHSQSHSHHHHHHHHPLSLSTSSSTGTHASADQLSIHSAASSSKISLSRSFSSIPRNSNNNNNNNNNNSAVPHSPLSPYFRTHAHSLQRQNSVSSASTQSTGASSRLQALGPRSAGNLYHLASLAERNSSLSTGTGADTVADPRIAAEDAALDDVDDDPEAADYESAMKELNDIRRRKEELNARFTSKLEYLKAKLRAAELHERVMRR